MKNILWKKPDGSIAITEIHRGKDSLKHARTLQSRGDVPADWEIMGCDKDLPEDKFSLSCWRLNPKTGDVIVEVDLLKNMVKNRLRAWREERFKQLGVPYKLKPEIEADMIPAEVRKELQKLRDITNQVDGVDDPEELVAIARGV